MKPFACLCLLACAPLQPTHALLLNGGGTPEKNYASHVGHITKMQKVLGAAGISDVTILASDGSSSSEDMAVQVTPWGEDAWLLEGTPLGSPLRYANSPLHAKPATFKELRAWFDDKKKRLHDGDTVFLFVTDHGVAGKTLLGTQIVLWGETVSVTQLDALLRELPSTVRVVMVMGQCHSGAFAAVSASRPNTCGFFSTTADRVAYGCYAEAASGIGLGYADNLIEALKHHETLSAAHARTLLTDQTPDVPLRTSDAFLEHVLQGRRDWWSLVGADAVGRAEPLAAHYGLAVPDSADAYREMRASMEHAAKSLRTAEEQWRIALDDFTNALFETYAHAPDAVRSGDLPALQAAVLARVRQAYRTSAAPHAQIALAREKHALAKSAAFRMETRLAALQRILMQLRGAAALTLLSPEQRATHTALVACEAMSIGTSASEREPPLPRGYPPVADDISLVDGVQPAVLRVTLQRREGKTFVVDVTGGGLRPGDELLDGGAARIVAAVGSPHLRVRRAGVDLRVEVADNSAPGRFTESEQAALSALLTLDGRRPASLGRGQKRVLFFWATWCVPCKQALPEMAEFARAHPGSVVMVTQEDRAFVNEWLSTHEVPGVVLHDPLGNALRVFGFSGTPAFVLFDDYGRVFSRQTGYRRGMLAH